MTFEKQYAIVLGDRHYVCFYMIEIFLTSYFVLSSIYGSTTIASTTDYSVGAAVAPKVTIEEKASKLPTRKEIEILAKEYFKNEPILVEIAKCESEFRQYDTDGNVLTGKVNKSDVGVMQINKYYHLDKAESLGYDLHTVEGNMAYAKYLYQHEGVQPWISSSPCWKSALKDEVKNQVALK